MLKFALVACLLEISSPCSAFLHTKLFHNSYKSVGSVKHKFQCWTRAEAQSRSTVKMLADGTQQDAKNGAWLPVGSASNFVGNVPISVELIGVKLVVWRNGTKWSVMKDVCPHRLAPLSQGRVDPSTGCIECPYHGWQFEAGGRCTSIPQSDETDRIKGDRLSAVSFPVRLTGDLIWAYLPLPAGQASSFPRLPEEVFPAFEAVGNFMVRDLPYSFDFLVENLMDPAHIPFAHHGLQGTRKDARPIPVERLTARDDASLLELSFQDVSGGRERDGVVSFAPPCYFHFRTRSPTSPPAATNWSQGIFPDGRKLNLLILTVPVAPGRSRAILGGTFGRKLPIPSWIIHFFSNRFLDSDIWIHDQELSVTGPTNSFVDHSERTSLGGEGGGSASQQALREYLGRFALATDSDKGTRAWREFWAEHMSSSQVFGRTRPPSRRSRAELVDWYEGHTKYCVPCRVALASARKVRTLLPGLALLGAAAGNSVAGPWAAAAGAAAAWAAADAGAAAVVRAVTGPEREDPTSAAQM